MAAVIGIIGYTHGVRLVSTPPANSAGSASAGLPLSIWAIEPSCTGMGSEVGGLTAAMDAPSYPLKLQGSLRRRHVTGHQRTAPLHRSPRRAVFRLRAAGARHGHTGCGPRPVGA